MPGDDPTPCTMQHAATTSMRLDLGALVDRAVVRLWHGFSSDVTHSVGYGTTWEGLSTVVTGTTPAITTYGNTTARLSTTLTIAYTLQPAPPSAEEIMSRLRAVRRMQDDQRAHYQALDLQIGQDDAARQAARAILLAHLDARQAGEYTAQRRFTVRTPSGRRLWITYGTVHNIWELDEEDDRIATYCAHPAERLPTEDVMLAQKLLLEADEAAFFAVAHAHNYATFDDDEEAEGVPEMALAV